MSALLCRAWALARATCVHTAVGFDGVHVQQILSAAVVIATCIT